MNNFEATVTADIDVRRYPFKWKEAKRMAKGDPATFDYWMAVRQLYLEMGGEYVAA